MTTHKRRASFIPEQVAYSESCDLKIAVWRYETEAGCWDMTRTGFPLITEQIAALDAVIDSILQRLIGHACGNLKAEFDCRKLAIVCMRGKEDKEYKLWERASELSRVTLKRFDALTDADRDAIVHAVDARAVVDGLRRALEAGPQHYDDPADYWQYLLSLSFRAGQDLEQLRRREELAARKIEGGIRTQKRKQARMAEAMELFKQALSDSSRSHSAIARDISKMMKLGERQIYNYAQESGVIPAKKARAPKNRL
jgi:hypothetical protein